MIAGEAVLRPVADVAVDLGTSTTQVFVRGEGVVAEDLTLVAIDRRSRKIAATGRNSLYLDDAQVIAPLQGGTVADPTLAGAHLAAMLRPFAGGRISRYSLVITVPSSATPMERRVVREAGKRAGASKVRLIEQTMAAAIGGDLRIHEAAGTMIVSAGAGITEVALVALGSTVAQSSCRVGGLDIDTVIKAMLRREYGIAITDATAELIKLTAADAIRSKGDTPMVEAQGIALTDETVTTAILDVSELTSAFDLHALAVTEAVRQTLVQAAPELSQDVIMRGIHLAGGAALSANLADHISETFKLPVHVLPEAQHAAILGAGSCLETADNLKELFLAERS